MLTSNARSLPAATFAYLFAANTRCALSPSNAYAPADIHIRAMMLSIEALQSKAGTHRFAKLVQPTHLSNSDVQGDMTK